MTLVKTNLDNVRERARQLRFEPGSLITQTNTQRAIEQLLTLGVAPTPTIVSATPYALLATDVLLEINVANCVINPGAAASRNGLPVFIHDITGNASGAPHTFNVTVETVINPQLSTNYGTIGFYPSGANWRFRQ
jgi:hypothetical protein